MVGARFLLCFSKWNLLQISISWTTTVTRLSVQKIKNRGRNLYWITIALTKWSTHIEKYQQFSGLRPWGPLTHLATAPPPFLKPCVSFPKFPRILIIFRKFQETLQTPSPPRGATLRTQGNMSHQISRKLGVCQQTANQTRDLARQAGAGRSPRNHEIIFAPDENRCFLGLPTASAYFSAKLYVWKLVKIEIWRESAHSPAFPNFLKWGPSVQNETNKLQIRSCTLTSKSVHQLVLEHNLEFAAQNLAFSSTIGTYLETEYERKTPTQLRVSAPSIFGPAVQYPNTDLLQPAFSYRG